MVKKRMIAMLLAGGQGSRLGVLTNRTAKPAVPFGGKYRIIDFPLSNCVNSGIDTVGVLTQYEPLELNGYVGNGSPWDLDRNSGGIYVLPPYVKGSRGEWYSGTANAIYQNIPFVERYSPECVLVISGDHIYKMNYLKMLRYHMEHKADATIAVLNVPLEEAHRFGIMSTDDTGRITEFAEKPKQPKSTKASMGIYIFNWALLKEYLIADAADETSHHDFGKDVIPKLLSEERRLFAYEFNGYWKDVGTIKSLWEANMDMIGESELSLEDKEWRVYTRSAILPAHYVGTNSQIESSLVTEGCEIEGRVRHSVISTDVQMDVNTEVVDSIIMTGARIKSGARIYKAIVGEGAIVGESAIIGAEKQNSDADYDTALTGDITLVGSGTTIAPFSRIPQGMIVNADYKGEVMNEEEAAI